MQASQNTAQVFLGINLKCNSCHDSFVSKWKLKDAYALAAYFAPDPKLQLYRCDVAQNRYAEPGFLFPELGHAPASELAAGSARRGGGDLHRSAQRPAAAHAGQPHLAAPARPRHRRQPRRDGRPAVEPGAARLARQRFRRSRLRHQASDRDDPHFARLPDAGGGADGRAAGARVCVRRSGSPAADGGAVRATPSARSPASGMPIRAVGRGAGAPPPPPGSPLPSMPPTAGVYAREWRVASSNLTRALGRPIRDQVIPRPRGAGLDAAGAGARERRDPHALAVARRATDARRDCRRRPLSLLNRTVAGRGANTGAFDVDVSKARHAVAGRPGERIERAGAHSSRHGRRRSSSGAAGATPLSSLTPGDGSGLRAGTGPIQVTGANGARRARPEPVGARLRHRGQRVHSFRGVIGIENPPSRNRIDARTRRSGSSCSTRRRTWNV